VRSGHVHPSGLPPWFVLNLKRCAPFAYCRRMIKLLARVDLALRDPEADDGFITWIHCTISVVDDDPDDLADDDAPGMVVGSAAIAIVHVTAARDHDAPLFSVMDSDSTELCGVYETYFDRAGEYREEFDSHYGQDLLYIADISIPEPYRERNIDFAAFRQVCLSFGGGCGLIVMPYADELEARRWAKMGLIITTKGEEGD